MAVAVAVAVEGGAEGKEAAAAAAAGEASTAVLGGGGGGEGAASSSTAVVATSHGCMHSIHLTLSTSSLLPLPPQLPQPRLYRYSIVASMT